MRFWFMPHRREHEQALLGRVERLFERILEVLEEVRDALPPRIKSFQIKERTMQNYPGGTVILTAAPVPADATVATPPTWTTSDSTNGPISVDPTGLICTINIPTSAPVGTEISVSVTDTNADGAPVQPGTFTLTLVPPPPPPVIDIT